MGIKDTREAIQDATVAVYGREGSQGFSMRAVAVEAGITATAIYRHFGDKAALARALVERARRLLGGYMLDGLSGKDSVERLRSCTASYVRFVSDHPQLYRLLFMDPLDHDLPDVHALQSGEEAAPFRFVIDRIREAMDEGFLALGDPGKVTLTVWAIVHGLCTLAIAGRVPAGDLQGLCVASLSDLYDGLKRRDGDG
jgi:AcrR family transcriptional regulator